MLQTLLVYVFEANLDRLLQVCYSKFTENLETYVKLFEKIMPLAYLVMYSFVYAIIFFNENKQ